jgi:hypothetical protein
MKKLILALSLIGLIGTANAQHYGHYGYYRGGGWGWVAPAVIGGAVVYAATRPQVVVQPSPTVVYLPPSPTAPYPPPIGYHWEQMLDGNCNCYRLVLIPG